MKDNESAEGNVTSKKNGLEVSIRRFLKLKVEKKEISEKERGLFFGQFIKNVTSVEVFLNKQYSGRNEHLANSSFLEFLGAERDLLKLSLDEGIPDDEIQELLQEVKNLFCAYRNKVFLSMSTVARAQLMLNTTDNKALITSEFIRKVDVQEESEIG